ncbi:hypothetical protein V8F33_008064, partial [Rhypophila sp. PSN 637]
MNNEGHIERGTHTVVRMAEDSWAEGQSLTGDPTAQYENITSCQETAVHTHPSNAAQAKAFTAPGSLSFPGAAGELTPPSSVHNKGSANGAQLSSQAMNGSGVTPA